RRKGRRSMTRGGALLKRSYSDGGIAQAGFSSTSGPSIQGSNPSVSTMPKLLMPLASRKYSVSRATHEDRAEAGLANKTKYEQRSSTRVSAPQRSAFIGSESSSLKTRTVLGFMRGRAKFCKEL